MGRSNTGKKKVTQQEEEPRARKKSNRGKSMDEGGNSQQQQQLSYAEIFRANNPQDTAWSDLFYREDRKTRYNQIQSFGFTQEKGFSDEMKAVPAIYNELHRRNWLKFNNLMLKDNVIGNAQLVREFYANARKESFDVHTDKAYVRGVMVDFSALAINEFLEASIPARCIYENESITFAQWPEVRRREIRDFVGRPGTPWMKYSGGEFPSKIDLQHFRPVARAWAEFVVHNVVPVSNSSEFQVENAMIVMTIMKKWDINLGQLLNKSIRKIANHGQAIFRLAHCNLITALCQHNHVPEIELDTRFKPIRGMTLRYFNGLDDGPVVVRARGGPEELREEEDEEMAEIDRYESGEHPTQQQPQEMPRHPYTEDDVSALMLQLAIGRAVDVPHTYYGDQSIIYQEARAREANFRPPPLYPRYSTLARLQAQHAIENAQRAARQLDEVERWPQDYAAYQERSMFDEADLGLGDRRDGSGSSHPH
ncbi:unnamed protein product [Trifolium pratense]|uniref:Uncharacterized protein n=1 Tax=Trifolium pratense TaxID=57577 RepID=A0ACB0M5R6_TRIPR|nr:unnamed protein product [Trifolium pratense]